MRCFKEYERKKDSEEDSNEDKNEESRFSRVYSWITGKKQISQTKEKKIQTIESRKEK